MYDDTGRPEADTAGAALTPVVVELRDGSAARVVSWAAGWAASQHRPLAVFAAHPVRRRHVVVRRQLRHLARVRFELVLGPLRARHPGLVILEYLTWDDIEQTFLRVSGEASAVVLQRDHLRARSTGRLTHVGAHARCSVIVLPEEVDRAPRPAPVVLGLDDSPEAWEAAEFAVAVARGWRSGLAVVHAWDVPVTVRPEEVAARRLEEAAHRRIAPLVARLRREHPGLLVSYEVVRGQPVPVLLARSQNAGLLVVGSRGRGGVAGLLLGSVSTELMAAASAPVAVARTGAADAPSPDEAANLLGSPGTDLVGGR